MRTLALVAVLASTAALAAGSNPGGGPLARCAACSLLPAGAVGSDLTLSGAFVATTVATSGTIRFGTQLLNGNGQVVMANSQLGFSDIDINGNTTNVTGQTSVAIVNANAMTRGMDRYILSAWPDSFGTVSARLTTNGTWLNAAAVGTAASGTGVTASYSGAGPYWLHKVVVTNAAMTAAGTTDITLALTPANSRIVRVIAEVTQVFTGGALTAVTVQCGKTAGGTEYLLQNSVFTAQNTWGDVFGEVGNGLLTASWGDFGTSAAGVPGAITVQCRFTCTTANCNAATQGNVNFYVEGVTYF